MTGGHTGWNALDSTEVYHPSAGEWREVPGGALPRPMRAVRVVTFNNRVLLVGEKISNFNWLTISSNCIYKGSHQSWSSKSQSQRGRRSGLKSEKCQKKDILMQSPSLTLKTLKLFVSKRVTILHVYFYQSTNMT